MIIKEIKIENLRVLRDVSLDLAEGMNVIIGVNGAGKSSILRALRTGLSRVIPKLTVQDESNAGIISLDPDDRSFDCSKEEDVILNIDLSLENIPIKQTVCYSPYEPTGERWETNFKPDLDVIKKSGEGFRTAPLAFYCSPRRSIPGFGSDEETHVNDERERAYPGALSVRGIYIDEFAYWFGHEQNRPDSRSVVTIDLLNEALSRFLNRYEDLHVEEDHAGRPDLRVMRGGHSISLHKLSDGERGTLAIVFDLARRLAQANPNSSNPLEERAIVLIDEIELHLHPQWQRKIVDRLTEIFPGSQFICTTHSPQVISEVQPESLFVLNETEDGVRVQQPGQAFGLDTNWILESLMGTQPRPNEAQEKIREIEDHLSEGNLGEARSALEEFRDIIHGYDPKLSYLESKIENLESLADEADPEEPGTD